METVQTSATRIDITHADIEAWIATHDGDLKPADVKVRRPLLRPDRRDVALELVWDVSRAYLDAFLKSVIPNLPTNYSVQVVEGDPTIAARVSWAA
jgi:hypothetical protein